MEEKKPRLLMNRINKHFPGVKALTNVSLRMFPGEIHALMGQNGAGKSTLIKVLTGVYSIDAGEIWLDDKEIRAQSPLEAQELGISTVYQEVNLCTNLTVSENIFIGREPMKRGRINWKEMNAHSKELLKRLNVDIDPTKQLGDYSVAIQQMVAIARALNISAKVLILDEPTSSLDANEVSELFKVMRKLKSEGLAILFVTHFLDQVYEMSDRITILRNGEFVGEYKAEELSRMELVSKMIGKAMDQMEEVQELADSHTSNSNVTPFLETKRLARKGSIERFDLKLYPGEILSLAGLLGSGRTEIARILFGADRADQGELTIKGKSVNLKSPRTAIDHGIAFCPENRKSEAIIEDLTIRENIILAMQASLGIFKYLSKKKQTEFADVYIKLLNIKAPGPETLIKNLSGGNQQKVILGRWLLTNPDLLILDEPTRGIDVGAKAEIMKQMGRLCQKGMSILFISSELEEVVRTSHRIAILRDRHKIAEMDNHNVSQQDIMKAIAGGIPNEK
ncbi:sugar ABC transporter ATP-binding protein [Paenibacillus sp. J22TS3]|uniref:sugar ABC transporter ATP-binding protein n=1 Tax=Paenibacillus sp. J22TS3 TaxID=2807192 RepID=UPI001B127AFD|nr:sugar ABC transporter ATP-binding protein [Paenibacillus sp. J22TS3]GIP20638.1 sugar ABC transporter ATP-binding protein [Paenibacillus sp. J22TS3]